MSTAQPVSTRPLWRVCLALALLGVLATGFGLLQRIRAERSSRAVELVVEYPEVEALAGTLGQPVYQVLERLRAAGATAVALPEETLETLADDGQITVDRRTAWLELSPSPDWSPTDAAFTITAVDAQVRRQVEAGLARVYAAEDLYRFPAPTRLMVRGSISTVSELGLGLSSEKIAVITRAGLRVIPRLHDIPQATPAKLRDALAEIAGALPAADGAGQRGIIIFDGTRIPGSGNRAMLGELARQLQAQELVYGMIEFGKQRGDASLGNELHGQIVRVHSITRDELATMPRAEAVQRFGLAVKDRNIRVLYLRFPGLDGADPLRKATGYVNSVAREVRGTRGMGFVTADQRAAHPFAAVTVPSWLLALLFAGAGAGLLLWLLAMLPTAMPRGSLVAGYLLLSIGLLAAIGMAYAAEGPGRTLFGLIAAIGYPMLALTWAWRRLERVLDTPPKRILLPAIAALIITTAITLVGGLLIAAMMGDTRFLVKIGQFSGVKAAMALPLLLFAAMIVADALSRPGEDFQAYRARCQERFYHFMTQPVYLWGMTIGVIALAAVALMLMRSGNDGGVGVSALELKFRALLDQLVIARPRTKEFLIGMPFFLFAMVAAWTRRRQLALALLLGAAIGQVDVLNTYCHAHTPVLLSLLRTVNGLWAGIIIGVALLWIFARHALRPLAATRQPATLAGQEEAR